MRVTAAGRGKARGGLSDRNAPDARLSPVSSVGSAPSQAQLL